MWGDKKLAEHRRLTKEEQGDKGAVVTFTKGSNFSTDLTRRTARDRPDIIERMTTGEFGSFLSQLSEADGLPGQLTQRPPLDL